MGKVKSTTMATVFQRRIISRNTIKIARHPTANARVNFEEPCFTVNPLLKCICVQRKLNTVSFPTIWKRKFYQRWRMWLLWTRECCIPHQGRIVWYSYIHVRPERFQIEKFQFYFQRNLSGRTWITWICPSPPINVLETLLSPTSVYPGKSDFRSHSNNDKKNHVISQRQSNED